MDSNQKFLKKWNEIRKKGKWRYIFFTGMLNWGIKTSLLFFFIINLMDYGLNIKNYFSGNWIISFLVIFIMFFLGGGITFGFGMWNFLEKKYTDLK